MITAPLDVSTQRLSADYTPVAVTRWTARLVDPAVERAYLLHCFRDDRRRVLFLAGLVAFAGVLNFVAGYAVNSAGFQNAILPSFLVIVLPLLGFFIALRLRSPPLMQMLILIVVAVGLVARLMLLTMRGDSADSWLTLMVGMVFVVYMYLPIRLVASTALAVGFSCIAPSLWSLALGPALPTDVYYRGLVWLLLANGLGFTAANLLQRSQRMQFAQGLVMRHLLSTDAMTGIANRRRFDSALEAEWRRCGRSGRPLSLLMIDVDHFKAYNDYCGHPQGDACLRELAQLFVETIGRPGDTVARYGGEEFVVLMPETGTAGALAAANRLAAALRHADIAHPRSPAGPRLTISMGAATVKTMTGEPAALVEFADRLLYAAKAAGRNQISVGQLNPAIDQRAA